MHRFYCVNIDEYSAELAEGEAHHLVSVLRLKSGDEAELFDGRGTLAKAVIETAGARKIDLRIETIERFEPSAWPKIIIASSIAKSDRFDWLIEKCTEIGVDRISAVIFERTVKKSANPKTLERWKRIAVSAAKQSGRLFLPVIDKPASLDEVIKSLKEKYTNPVFLYGSFESNAKALWDITIGKQNLIVFIGPEGGFSDVEKDVLESQGIIAVRITQTVLRVETAALAFASILAARRDSIM